MSRATATARRLDVHAGDTARQAPVREAEVRPDLRVLAPPPFRAPRGPFVLTVGAVLTLGLLGVLLLNTVVTQDAFAVSALQATSAELADREEALTQEVAAAESPQQLEERARALGMVPSKNPVFLRLSDGTVLGEPVAGSPARTAAAPAAAQGATGAAAPSTETTGTADGRTPADAQPRTPTAVKTKAARAEGAR
jgi:cell division protein FtsB